MSRFLIEVPHDNNQDACIQVVCTFMAGSSHSLTNADWGCAGEEHKAWLIVDLDDKAEPRRFLPAHFSDQA